MQTPNFVYYLPVCLDLKFDSYDFLKYRIEYIEYGSVQMIPCAKFCL